MASKNYIDELNIPNHFFLPKKLEVNPALLNVKKQEIFRILGMSEPEMDKYVLELIEHYINDCKSIITPLAGYSIFKNPQFSPDKCSLDQVQFDLGRMVNNALRKSTCIAIFVCTCGNWIENLSKQLMKNGNSLEGFIVDLIGSEFAEEIANYVHNEIAKTAKVFNLNVTNRYSPGYCNWPVSDQKKLFSLLEGNSCDIQLTPSSLMIPLKSVSGMIGIGTKVKTAAYKCKLCSDEKCIIRKIDS